MVDIMLERFIDHNQLFEFIEVFKSYHKDDNKSDIVKAFLSKAIESSATSIASYLLLDAGVNPNFLSGEEQMGVLHKAVQQ